MTATSAVPAIKRALVSLLRTTFATAAVTYGSPTNLPNQLAMVGNVEAEHTRPTSGGAKRSVEESVDVSVILSCYAPGLALDTTNADYDAQIAATEAVYVMLDALTEAFRDRSIATLGGACQAAIVSKHKLDEYAIEGEGGAIIGRSADITATVTCRTRL